MLLVLRVRDAGWREKGVQNFAFHPDFAREGAPGGRIFLLNKHDGVLRVGVPEAD